MATVTDERDITEVLNRAYEVSALRENMRLTQERCNELLAENRALKHRCSRLEAIIKRVIGFTGDEKGV